MILAIIAAGDRDTGRHATELAADIREAMERLVSIGWASFKIARQATHWLEYSFAMSWNKR